MSAVLDLTAVQHATSEGAILVARCPKCGNAQAMPCSTCFRCGTGGLVIDRHGGTGMLYSWSVTGTAFEPEVANEVPYIVAVVQLDGGAKIWGRLVGVEPTSERLNADLPVALDANLTRERGYLVFRPHGQA